jgi:aminobenzoyl-glutamate utilization protein B
VNHAGAYALQENLELLGPITYTPDEETFAKQIQDAFGVTPIGMQGNPIPFDVTEAYTSKPASDVGDVSWIVPELTLTVTTAPAKVPFHSWGIVACDGMSIGHKGMLYAAKALAMTMVDLFEKEELRVEIKKEFLERKGSQRYEAMIPDGPPIDPSAN